MSEHESYPPTWKHCTIHWNPVHSEMHFDGDPSAVAECQSRLGATRNQDLEAVINELEELHAVTVLEFHNSNWLSDSPRTRNLNKQEMLEYCLAILRGQPGSIPRIHSDTSREKE